jgi:hypothetical protein
LSDENTEGTLFGASHFTQVGNMTDLEALRGEIEKFEKILATLVCLRPTIYADSEGNIYPQFLDFPPRPCPHCKALAMLEELRRELRLLENSKE